MNLDECPLDPVKQRDDLLVFEKGEKRVELVHDPIVDDWMVVYRTGDGVGQPGGVRHREDAIEYAMYCLGEIEKTDVRPVERIS